MRKACFLKRTSLFLTGTAALVATSLAWNKQQQTSFAEEKQQLKLLQVQIVARHCARTPIAPLPNTEDLNHEWVNNIIFFVTNFDRAVPRGKHMLYWKRMIWRHMK